MRKNIWFPLILITALWVLGISGAYFITVANQSSKASVIILEPNFLFYSDPAATHSIDNIKLPELTPGNVYTFTFYVKNTSSVNQNISAGIIFVPTSIGTLTITFDGQVQKTLAANTIAKADGILTVTGTDTENPIDFVVSINASPVTNTTTTYTTGYYNNSDYNFTTRYYNNSDYSHNIAFVDHNANEYNDYHDNAGNSRRSGDFFRKLYLVIIKL